MLMLKINKYEEVVEICNDVSVNGIIYYQAKYVSGDLAWIKYSDFAGGIDKMLINYYKKKTNIPLKIVGTLGDNVIVAKEGMKGTFLMTKNVANYVFK